MDTKPVFTHINRATANNYMHLTPMRTAVPVLDLTRIIPAAQSFLWRFQDQYHLALNQAQAEHANHKPKRAPRTSQT